MLRVDLHRRARKAVRSIPQAQSVRITSAIERIAGLDDPTVDPNVSKMVAEWEGRWRLRVGDYRVIFELVCENEETVVTLLYESHVGARGGICG